MASPDFRCNLQQYSFFNKVPVCTKSPKDINEPEFFVLSQTHVPCYAQRYTVLPIFKKVLQDPQMRPYWPPNQGERLDRLVWYGLTNIQSKQSRIHILVLYLQKNVTLHVLAFNINFNHIIILLIWKQSVILWIVLDC